MSRDLVGERGAALTRAQDVPPSLTDAFLEGYVCWREACGAVSWAYELWQSATRPDRILAFASYGAALDREEAAANLLSQRVERVRNWLR
jgi:hypothetical protein